MLWIHIAVDSSKVRETVPCSTPARSISAVLANPSSTIICNSLPFLLCYGVEGEITTRPRPGRDGGHASISPLLFPAIKKHRTGGELLKLKDAFMFWLWCLPLSRQYRSPRLDPKASALA